MPKITCCMDCTKREPGCHSRCQEYIAQSAEHRSYVSDIRRKKRIATTMDKYRIEQVQKQRRAAG